jgi:hydrogenase maturation protease
MARTLVIAFGNPLRCDDGLGWRAAEQLSRLELPEDIAILRRQQLTPELVPVVSQASRVLFVDAARDGPLGEIQARPLLLEKKSLTFTHELSPGNILALSQELYDRCPEAFVISLAGENFDHGETLSQSVVDAMPSLIKRIESVARTGLDGLTS